MPKTTSLIKKKYTKRIKPPAEQLTEEKLGLKLIELRNILFIDTLC
jgi:hypothetical protein